MKLVVNMVMGIQLNALAEGVALTEASDLPVDDLLEILGLGAVRRRSLSATVPHAPRRASNLALVSDGLPNDRPKGPRHGKTQLRCA